MSTATQEPRVPVGLYQVEIPLPAGTTWISLNRAPRSRGEKIGWDKWKKRWRLAAYTALLNAGIPSFERIHLQVELRFVDRRVRDASNYRPTVKPMIDALQVGREYDTVRRTKAYGRTVEQVRHVIEYGAGIIPGDDRRYLVEPEHLIGPPIGRDAGTKGIVIFHITPLSAPRKDPS